MSLLWVVGQYSLIFSVSSPDPASETGVLAWIGDLRNAFLHGHRDRVGAPQRADDP